MSSSLFSTVILLCFSCLTTVSLAFGQQSKLDGKQIVQKMAAQYVNAKSYQDTGVVHSISGSEKPVIKEINHFKTFFVRPKLFRFEWNDLESSGGKAWYIVWSDAKAVFSYSDLMGFEREEDLGMAIAGATGISRGAAHSVPVLLMPDESGFRLTEMDRITLLREEPFEGEECFIVRGFHPFGFPIDMWISKRDFLIRKHREHKDDGTFDEEIRRDIKINHEIPLATFQFTPPGKIERLIGCLSVILFPVSIAISLILSKSKTN